MSAPCKDFIRKLLEKKPEKRLGTQGGVDEVLAHPWFNGLNMDLLQKKLIEPPMKPEIPGNQLEPTPFSPIPEISVIPAQKMKKVKQNSSAFEGFEKKPN